MKEEKIGVNMKKIIMFVLGLIDLVVSSLVAIIVVVSFSAISAIIGLIPTVWIFVLLVYDAMLAIKDSWKSFKKLRR